MLALVAVWALAEALVLFIVADVPIMAAGLRGNWRSGLIAAFVASLFAALGGLAMMRWAAADPAGTRVLLESLPGISPALFDAAAEQYRTGGWWAMLAGSLSGTPFKLYAHTAGMDGVAMAPFFIAAIAARLPRFAAVGVISGLAAPWLRQRLRPRTMWLVFAASWTVFYLWYWSAMRA